MALPMLVGGAECGPSNPLQALTKRFDQDRGLQQDHFGAASSREIFRSQQINASQVQDAARFFSPNAPQIIAEPAFDLAAMRGALSINPNSVTSVPKMQPSPFAEWSSDFMQLQHPPQTFNAISDIEVDPYHPIQNQNVPSATGPLGRMHWTPRMNSMPLFAPQMPMQHHPMLNPNRISWDKEFSAQELEFSSTTTSTQEIQQNKEAQQLHQPANDPDELARTAGMLLENVKREQNPKFQQSQFLGLMKQLRDGQVVVEGNKMVESEGRTASQVDVKGKGRAFDRPTLNQTQFQPQREQVVNDQGKAIGEDPNDAYFRRENADFIRYWNDMHLANDDPQSTAETRSWDKLQADWDQFEATSTGIKAITHYQFQDNNPYLLGDSSRTRHHLLHNEGQPSTFENVLQLEAAVQRDARNASLWYELGVKQQVNEREQKALQALERAVELDPSHMKSWLALAISYTNDNNRQGTYDAIYEWVGRNTEYKDAVAQFRAQTAEGTTISKRYSQLIQCLITMARSDTSGTINADIQVALAVLLNTNEEYQKAQDCFSTALAVNPDDWLLYNRVGATMANSGRAEEALNYYYRALELNPAYIRARFNLGISCINLRRYEEAAHHILDALVLQDSDGVRESSGSNRGVVSTALWDSLRSTCLHMQRADLAALCDMKNLEGFRENFQ